VQRLHLVGIVIHSRLRCGVQLLHPAVRLIAACLPGCPDAGGKARELVFQRGEVVVVQVVADQVHGQVPALRPLVGPLDLGCDDCRVAGPDGAFGLEPV
jgi:hypothetical protein